MSDLEEVVEVFEDSDADLVQVLEKAIEDGHQVGCRQLVAQDHRQLMDGEGQRSTHLPLCKSKKVRIAYCKSTPMFPVTKVFVLSNCELFNIPDVANLKIHLFFQ